MSANDKVPTPKSVKGLVDYITSLVDEVEYPDMADPNRGSLGEEGSPAAIAYEKSADAMWKAALAAFRYVAREVGASGFQAGWATMQFFRKANFIDGPFGFVKAEDALYPQYDLPEKVRGWVEEEWADWIKEKAEKNLAEDRAVPAVAAVIEHWRKILDTQ